MDSHDVQLLANLYWKQKAVVRHNGDISEWMSIKQVVRQGCVASPHLFAMYTEMIMRSLEDKVGLRIGGRVINNLRYADDTVILAETDGKCKKEVKRRIGIAKTAFTSVKKVLCGRNISMPVRLRVLKCYIWSTMLYRCEPWTLSKGMMKNLEAA